MYKIVALTSSGAEYLHKATATSSGLHWAIARRPATDPTDPWGTVSDIKLFSSGAGSSAAVGSERKPKAAVCSGVLS